MAYADFADQVERLTRPLALKLQIIPGEPPGVRFAPGLVSRSVLYGMFAINLRLRLLFPELASDLRDDTGSTRPLPRWPTRLRLRVGLLNSAFKRRGLLTSGIWSMRVDHPRQVHNSFADIVFWPFVWSLCPVLDDATVAQLGPQVANHLADASDWVHYGSDRTFVDLRTLTSTFPTVIHPVFAGRDEWVEMMTDDGTDAAPVLVHGLRPS